ncbi:MAG: helix-turn-helix domain-containing protein [Bryobacteraceae bacterium]
MPSIELSLAERILLTRFRIGESQLEFARRLNVSDQTVRDWEHGQRPGRNSMNRLSELFAEHLRETEAPETVIQQEEPEEPAIQLDLPFEPVNVALKIGPRTADTLHVEVRFERKTGTYGSEIQTDTPPNH